ncbi:MAG: hypothetical protein AAGN35_12885 [Bacteroidota bacterium]
MENQSFTNRRGKVCPAGSKRFLVKLPAWGTRTALFCLGILLFSACQKDPVLQEIESTTAEAALKKGDIFWPRSGGSCTLSPPPAPFWGAGNSTKKSWHRAVKNQNQLVSAINYVNRNGGTIFIDGTFNVNRTLPKITRDNVTILSRKAFKIYDKVSGSTSANELFRVEGANFTMKNVTILGVGHLNPNNPGSWSGKRSAIAVTKNNARFERVFIRYYTHAAIRLEDGSGHIVINSTLTNQNRSDLGYGVLLRNRARNVLVKRNRFDRNSHSVATTGHRDQSYRAEGNWTTNSLKWHFDVHMGSDGWGGNKVEIIHNVSNGANSLLLVRGPFRDGVYVRKNLHNRPAGRLVELKPDQTFAQNGTTFIGGNFYSPFGLNQTQARTFFRKGEITNNCVNQNYNAIRAAAN